MEHHVQQLVLPLVGDPVGELVLADLLAVAEVLDHEPAARLELVFGRAARTTLQPAFWLTFI